MFTCVVMYQWSTVGRLQVSSSWDTLWIQDQPEFCNKTMPQRKISKHLIAEQFHGRKSCKSFAWCFSIILLWLVRWAYFDSLFIDEGLGYAENKAVSSYRVQRRRQIQIESSNLERLLWPTVLHSLCQLDTSKSHLRGGKVNWKISP